MRPWAGACGRACAEGGRRAWTVGLSWWGKLDGGADPSPTARAAQVWRRWWRWW